MSFASFNPSDFIGNFDSPCEKMPGQTQFNLSNGQNPFLTPVSSQPSSNPEQTSNIKILPIHENIVCRLNEFIAKNKIPHIIFHGPSGSGKQTLVREFIQRIYGGDRVKIKTHVMTVNCSHGKGIQFIREELKFFAKANAQTKSNVDGGKSSEFKVITLLNAHHLTVDAQSALRRCIELFSYNTRFFIVVENKDKLLNPILSRFCDIFVPEPTVFENGPTVNLHQYVLSQQFKGGDPSHSVMPFPPSLQIKRSNKQLFDDNMSSLTSLFRHIDHLYESGVSCLDLMEHVKTNRDLWSEAEYHRAVMRFYQIKPQFRCEKLLMLFMINYLYREK